MRSQHLENIRAALEMSQPCRCDGDFVCTRCKGLAALDALALEPESRGVGMIAQERARQLKKEGYTQGHDAQLTHGELAAAAAYYCAVPEPDDHEVDARMTFETLWPQTFGESSMKRQGLHMPTLRDLVKAGSLNAAEIDRRLAAGEEA